MSIEVYLGRFGDEESPVGPEWAKSARKQILQAISLQTSVKPVWQEGRSRTEEPSIPLGGRDNLVNLQRCAAHLQFTGSPPEKPVEETAPLEALYEDPYLLRYWEAMHEDASWKTAEWDFRHLIWTGAVAAFYLLLEFPEPILLEEEAEGAKEKKTEEEILYSVGSAPRLVQELDRLNPWLQLPGDYGDLGEEAAWAIYEDESDPWHCVKWAWIVLHWMARQACERNLTMYVA